tara:strand:- start:207 stop:413 length:207 start_codon:yes stop_codon:yes gene_type:complete
MPRIIEIMKIVTPTANIMVKAKTKNPFSGVASSTFIGQVNKAANQQIIKITEKTIADPINEADSLCSV